MEPHSLSNTLANQQAHVRLGALSRVFYDLVHIDGCMQVRRLSEGRFDEQCQELTAQLNEEKLRAKKLEAQVQHSMLV